MKQEADMIPDMWWCKSKWVIAVII